MCGQRFAGWKNCLLIAILTLAGSGGRLARHTEAGDDPTQIREYRDTQPPIDLVDSVRVLSANKARELEDARLLPASRFAWTTPPEARHDNCGEHDESTQATEMIQIKRVYEKPSRKDGFRILVDRLWPRGLSKERAAVDEWLKEVAPSTELRKWFGHDPKKWKGFQTRYKKELAEKPDSLKAIKTKSRKGTVTLLYGARDSEHNEAIVLADVIAGRRR